MWARKNKEINPGCLERSMLCFCHFGLQGTLGCLDWRKMVLHRLARQLPAGSGTGTLFVPVLYRVSWLLVLNLGFQKRKTPQFGSCH
jgi:hypothetical protein